MISIISKNSTPLLSLWLASLAEHMLSLKLEMYLP